ncbi:hypothetical protein IQ07DRAFT_636046 [Pyrenochaeta sp. DS3sAY3a]|nr:hypothetical protein IQ07DRAFT_636046 [Pyrenochaeta sp. DS3sAY3a]
MRTSYTTRQPLDALDDPIYDPREQTGLLTRFVPERIKGRIFYRVLLRATRVLLFLSSGISLWIFSQRLYTVYRLVNTIKPRRGNLAVEYILTVATLYTLITALLGLIAKTANPGGRTLRWIWVLLDVFYVGAFIAATVLTWPNGGMASARHCYNNPSQLPNGNVNGVTSTAADVQDDSCKLLWATFVLAIISIFLHAFAASFHEIKPPYHRNRFCHEKTLQ